MAIRKEPFGNFEVLFRDSSEYFLIKNARMIFLKEAVMFVIFDEEGQRSESVYYPMCNIYRIKEVL